MYYVFFESNVFQSVQTHKEQKCRTIQGLHLHAAHNDVLLHSWQAPDAE